MEARLYKELVEREGKRRKQARLALRIEKEAMCLARRKDAGKQKMLSGAGANPDGIHQTNLIEWEEHDLEYQMASLGLEMDDLFSIGKEGVEKEDWLDVWMGSLNGVTRSLEMSMCMMEEDETMEIAILD